MISNHALPADKYLPSYLVRSEYEGNVFHILFAVEVKADNIRIITAYHPNLEEWEDGSESGGPVHEMPLVWI